MVPLKNNSNLLVKYLDQCFFIESKKNYFDPWLIIYNFPLLNLIAKKLETKIKSELNWKSIDGVCILANSGIPIGIYVALSMKLPIHYYFRDPIRFENQEDFYYVFPQISANRNYLLLDSHTVTLHTANSATEFIQKKGAKVEGLAVPFNFTDYINHQMLSNPPFKNLISLGNANDFQEVIYGLTRTNDPKSLKNLLIQRSKIQKYYNESPFIPKKWSRFYSLISTYLKRNEKDLSFESKKFFVNSSLAKTVRAKYGPQESDIWRLLCDSEIMYEVCQAIKTSLGKYFPNYIYATGQLGTIFALNFAFFSEFKGSMFTTYKPLLWDGHINENKCQNPIIFSGRLRTGLFIKNLHSKLLYEFNIDSKNIFVLRYFASGVKPPRNVYLDFHMKDIYQYLKILS